MCVEMAEKEKDSFEQVQAELQRAADDFAVFERKDIKHKEDMKHLKAKEKKLQVCGHMYVLCCVLFDVSRQRGRSCRCVGICSVLCCVCRLKRT
jgi:hypothetical protein